MKFCLLLIAALTVASFTTAMADGFSTAPGLQLYSLRSQIKLRGLAWALDQVKANGITELELIGSTYDLPLADFQKALADRGLKAVSTHFPYARYKTDLDNVVKEAQGLGVQFAGCAWIDHQGDFDEAECRDAIAVFSKASEALAKVGIKFFYHAHGYEFQPHGDGTLFDLFMKETEAAKVNVELDVLWIIFPGQDPVKLMEKYGSRWVLMHLKDLKKGVATGPLTGHTDVNNNVILGTGQANWPAIFAAAKKIGIKHFFIEDESESVIEQMPKHVEYMKSVQW
jgi:sugar phosphate isomerase/epimerase